MQDTALISPLGGFRQTTDVFLPGGIFLEKSVNMKYFAKKKAPNHNHVVYKKTNRTWFAHKQHNHCDQRFRIDAGGPLPMRKRLSSPNLLLARDVHVYIAWYL